MFSNCWHISTFRHLPSTANADQLLLAVLSLLPVIPILLLVDELNRAVNVLADLSLLLAILSLLLVDSTTKSTDVFIKRGRASRVARLLSSRCWCSSLLSTSVWCPCCHDAKCLCRLPDIFAELTSNLQNHSCISNVRSCFHTESILCRGKKTGALHLYAQQGSSRALRII